MSDNKILTATFDIIGLIEKAQSKKNNPTRNGT